MWPGLRSRWQENHGNLLMGFVAIVFFIGACVLVYRQNRFVPVRFPEGDMIDTPPTPAEEVEDAIVIRVTGAANTYGSMRVAIYDSAESFNQPLRAALAESVDIGETEAVWTISRAQLPARFAVAAYHDENADQELNRNPLGIPTERYGFSRNARGLTGPPRFDQAAIETPEIGDTVNVFIR